jgi:acetyltransferase EpsM
MTEPTPITVPLINPNEPGALLAALNISPRQHVHHGEILCTLETTKSTVDVIAEVDGYVVGLSFTVGQTIQAGEILAYLAESPDWNPPAQLTTLEDQKPSRPSNLRISNPALTLAQQHNVDLAQFSTDVFVTEKMVRELIEQSQVPGAERQWGTFDPNSIIIYGGGGHGKALMDLLRLLSVYSVAGFVDDGLQRGSNIMGAQVLGGSLILDKLTAAGVHLAANAVGGIGNIASRIAVFERLAQAGFTCPKLVHPTAFVEPSAKLSDGVQVMPHAYVGSEAMIGFGAIINTGAIVSHDCTVGDYANLSPGAILAGEVSVGSAALIGMGVTVNLRVKIGTRARVGNGATIKKDVPDNGLVHAGTIWPD